ncbi:YrdB family protein [Cohnella lupini]|uniref:Uncharacterized protein DUF2568 n=1 Tax=Cohnella lupini TaxID=1294267 RepID=A0A3D9IWW9_9BACL|nr:YrdB family protein [Cohnella lupini]RED66211.1 uncharacterized protein DUF2568 [Cohnella lupini]
MIFFRSVVWLIFFLMELFALFSYGYWWFNLDWGWGIQVVLGIGTPLLVAVMWGTYISPKAKYPVPIPAKIMIQSAVFFFAAAALYASGQREIAYIFAAVVLIEMLIVYTVKL